MPPPAADGTIGPRLDFWRQRTARPRSARTRGYHLFDRDGVFFTYDLTHHRFLCVPKACWDTLRLLAKRRSEACIVRALRSEHGEETVRRALHEIHEMRRYGFILETYEARVFADRAVDQLTSMDSGAIQINISQTCNLRCKYCYLSKNDALEGGLMTEEVGVAAVDFVFQRARHARRKTVWINFFGGEPLTNKPLLKRLVSYATDKAKREGMKVRFAMTTNGTLLDGEIVRLVKKHNFGLLISIDGGREVQDKMRPYAGGRGSFDDISRNVAALRRVRGTLSARVTLSRGSPSKIDIVKDLEALGFTRIAIGVARGTVEDRGFWDLPEERYDELEAEEKILVERYFEQTDGDGHAAYNPYEPCLRSILRPTETVMRCGVCRGTTTVTEGGKLYPCHRYVGMDSYVIGSLEDGLDRERIRRYFEEYFRTKSKCSVCWAQRLCGGVCPWYTSRRDGSMQPPGEAYCERIRRGFEDAAALLERVRSDRPLLYAKLAAQALKDDEEFETRRAVNSMPRPRS